ncbi:MogA/MoaB family molybdenum cofactor biosynthesis protein [Alkalicoccobacillus porphyridii]|uniref:Molybdenum cofactor biosynthesis protein B n=1 Tax=Alkalicoccobacillus porphyridii TaxID=2597270 RepID=A0A553ZXM9_9BACI|nr:MogA/MoaB family molybdenum cofactor biosynthesis protein [Alkalicoccobacillus porphyridii]TSB46209.1 MogA/MoaB family molybdenum cofactor biosynthesis protein [Alkalicoccobacillus porphyridii]
MIQSHQVVRCMILTVSATRTYENDLNGATMREQLEAHGHAVTEYQVCKDEYSSIQRWLKVAAARADIDAVLISGGTGIAIEDTTYEAVRDSLDKEMPGFGEIFRYLSFSEDIGTAAITSRAIAGVRDGKAIFSLPGTNRAVKLGMERIIVPELKNVVEEILEGNR